MRRVLVLLALAAPCLGGRAVLVHGAVVKGEVALDGEDVVIDGVRRPRAAFHLVEQDDGALVWAPDFERRLRGYRYLARAGLRRALAGLAARAVASGDRELARLVLERAEAAGFGGPEARALKARVEELERAPRQPDLAAARALRAELDDLDGLYVDLLVSRAEAADGYDGLRLLRAALVLDPLHAGARALLAARAPRDNAWEPRAWLDFELEIAARGGRVPWDAEDVLARFRRTWRKDLLVVRSGPLRIVTPVGDMRIVGRSLAFGRLACRALGEVFHARGLRALSKGEMTVLLFADEQEYRAKTGDGSKRENAVIVEGTSGYYSSRDRLSRFYWRSDPDAEYRLVGTLVHEITHQWLTERNPHYAEDKIRRQVLQPGFWIVEGFATFMEEGVYDVESMTWSLFDARAFSLDVVNSLAGSGQLIPWRQLYALNQTQFFALPQDDIRYVRRWAMGDQLTSKRLLFYAQAAATCHYLYHADGGRYRPQLVRYIVDCYLGRNERLSPETAFGVTPDELGRRVVAYAGKVARGWRPG